jgi:hypothetical protein
MFFEYREIHKALASIRNLKQLIASRIEKGEFLEDL